MSERDRQTDETIYRSRKTRGKSLPVRIEGGRGEVSKGGEKGKEGMRKGVR